MTKANVQIGDKFFMKREFSYRFDEITNYREIEISGETKQSWLVGHHKPIKIPKRDTSALMTREEVDQYIWMQKNSYKIGGIVATMCRNGSYEKLKQIAEIIEYKETE